MRDMMQRAKQDVDQAEVYSVHRKTVLVQYQKGNVELVAHRDGSATALRVISEGRLGTSFGSSPEQSGLLADARNAAAFGPPMAYGFASSQPPAAAPTSTDPQTEQMTADDAINLCEGIAARIARDAPDALVGISCQSEARRVRVATTEGVDVASSSTHATLSVSVPFAGGSADAGLHRLWSSISPVSAEDDQLAELLEWRNRGAAVSCPSTGRLPVLLSPQASALLTIPLSAGLDGLAVMHGVSPLANRVGEQILSERISLRCNRRDPSLPNARPFDDEGVTHQPRLIVDRGVLRAFTTDLRSAQALGLPPTGDAVRRTLFTDGVQDPPIPWLTHTTLAQGDISWKEMLATMDEGILITGTRGLHSSNISQGHFSVGVDGFHIVHGKVAGRLEKTLITGNIYTDFQSITSVSTETEETLQGGLSIAGRAPYLLIDSVQVSVG